MRKSRKLFAAMLSAAMLVTSFSNCGAVAFASQVATVSNDVCEDVEEDAFDSEGYDYIALNEQMKEEASLYYEESVEVNELFSGAADEEIAVQEVGTVFPSSVDLSESEYFPAVGDQSFNGNCGYWSNYYTSLTYLYNKTRGVETTADTSINPIFGYVFYGRSLEDSAVIASQIGYPTMGVLPLDHYGTNTFSPYKEVWEDALMHRLSEWVDYKNFGDEDSIVTGPKDASLNQIKQVLYNGGIVGVGTLSAKWNYSVVASGEYEGEIVIDRCDGTGYGGHGLSIVGYNDDIWVDINYDGEVQEAEMGAFKIVNSWGDEWGNKGFVWLAYDAVNATSQVLTSSEETRINNAIAAGTLKANKVNNSARSSFFMGTGFSTPKLREKDTSGCLCYMTVNTGSRKEMEMSVTATNKADGTSKTYNFPSIIYDKENYAWDGTTKSTNATMVFDLDNLISDISGSSMEDYTWKVTFGDSTLDESSLTVKDVYFTVDGVKKYTTSVSKIPLNGTERTYTMALGNTQDSAIVEENKKNVTIYYSNSSFDDANIHYQVGSGSWTTAPGVQMCTDSEQSGYTWKYVVNLGTASSLTLCFNNGDGAWDNNGESDYVIKAAGCYGIKNGVITELEEVVDVPVEGITLDKESISLYEEEQAIVTATISPADATDKTVTWTSSDTKVATVSNGVITGVASGTATITATTRDGLTAKVSVTVSVNPAIVKPTGVAVLPISLALMEGDTYTASAAITPANATNKTVTWTSSDTKVATVNSAGLITAVSEGEAVVTATTCNGLTAKLSVTVEAEELLNLENGVYFEKPSGWGSAIYAYMWVDGTKEELLGKWPGTKIDNLQDSIYGFPSTASEGTTMIIFNDGSNQTDDLKFYENGYYNKNGFVKKVTEKGKVYVNCVDEDGNALSIKSMSGEVGSSYLASAETIEGYTLITTPSNATGTYTNADITVTYVYKYLYDTAELEASLKVNGSTANQTANVGDSITLKVEASGGSGSYTYTYKAYNGSKWITLKSAGAATTFTDTLTSVGYKRYVVVVKDSNGETVDSNKITVTVKAGALSGTLKVDGSTANQTVNVGTSVTLKVAATGGSGSYTYTYKAYNGSKWVTLKRECAATTFTDTLTSVGYKRYVVVIKDSTGTTVDTNKITVTAKESSALAGLLKVNGSTSSFSLKVGDTVTLNVTPSGGSGSYTYAYKVYNGSKWITLQNYTTSKSFEYVLDSAGSMRYVVVVKDSSGATVDTNKITITIK